MLNDSMVCLEILMRSAVKKVLSTAVLLSSITLLTAGCSSAKDSIDLVPPVVSSTYPSNEAFDIPVTSVVTATFDKSVTGVSSLSMTLERVGDFGTVNANVIYDAAAKTVTLSPVNSLANDSIYVVTMTSDIKSSSGVALSSVSWVFTTGAVADTVRPSVSVSPSDSSSFVSSNSPAITAAFSEPVLSSTVTSESFILTNIDTGSAVSLISVSAYPSGSSCTKAYLVLGSDAGGNAFSLDDWTKYKIELTDSITDLSGNKLNGSVTTFLTDDTTSPKVVSRYPESGAVDIPASASISVTFSERLKSSTIQGTTTSFILEDVTNSAQIIVPAVYYDGTLTAKISPVGGPSKGTEYKVTLTSGITDRAENTLSYLSRGSWSFTTGWNSSDTIAPTVSSATPASGTTGVSTTQQLTVDFSELVTGVNDVSFTVTKTGSSTPMAAAVVYSSSSREAMLTTLAAFEEGADYTISLTSAITDGSGNALVPVSWHFMTADATKPTVKSRTPLSGEGSVGTGTAVAATFSETVCSVGVTTFTVEDLSGAAASLISGGVTYDALTKTAVFNPDSGFSENTKYRATLTSGISDSCGNTLNTVSWTFTTGTDPDTAAPAVSGKSPASGVSGVSTSGSVSVVFSEAVAGVTASTILLLKGDYASGSQISAQVAYDASSLTAVLTPDSTLDYLQQYTVVVKGNAGIKDSSGNVFGASGDEYWSFTTVADTTAPVVISMSPESGSPDIPGNAISIQAVFSEKVNNVTALNFAILDPGGNTVPYTAVDYAYNVSTKLSRATLTLSDPANYPISTVGQYTVSLSSAITDMSGNALSKPAWTLGVVAIDATPPTLVSVTPVSGGIWRNGTVSAIFSEDVKNVNATSFYITDPSGTKVSADCAYSTGILTAELTASDASSLPYNTMYTGHLLASITDIAGNTLSSSVKPLTWTFTTEPDNIPPTVTSMTPSSGTTGVPINSFVTAAFSESLAGYSTSSFYIQTGGVTVPATVTCSGTTLTLVPSSSLGGSTTYTVYLTSSITDCATSPNPLSPVSWTFTTQDIPDSTPPAVSSTYPAAGATGIAQSVNPTVTFSENVSNAASYIQLREGSSTGSTVSATVSYDPATYIATVIPDSALSSSTGYCLVISKNIMDMSNNSLGTTKTVLFTSAADTAAPFVSASSYLKGSSESNMPSNTTGVAARPTLYLDFSEAVTGATASNITLYRTSAIGTPTTSATAVAISHYVDYDATTHRATLSVKDTSTTTGNSTYATETVNGNLLPNTTYRIRVSTAVSDAAGNAIAQTDIYFTTITLPKVTLSDPAPGATGVSLTTSAITFTFSRSMDTTCGFAEIYDSTNSTYQIPATPGLWVWSTATNTNDTLTIQLKGQFKAGTKYRVRLYGWDGTFKDTDGNAISVLSSDYISGGDLSFTTTTASTPSVYSTVPAASASVGLSYPVAVFNFSEQMKAGTGTAKIGSTALTGTWSNGNRTVAYPVSSLTSVSGSYTVTLTGFTNAAGTALPASTLSFTVGAAASSIIFSEGFEGSTSPGTSYFKNGMSSGDYSWQNTTPFQLDGSATVMTPPSGSALGLVQTWLMTQGTYSNLDYIGTFDMSTNANYLLSFSMAHGYLYNQFDRIHLMISTDGGTNWQDVSVGKIGDIMRYDWSLSANAWQTHYVDLTPFKGSSSTKLRIQAVSGGEMGGNVMIDNVVLTRY